MPLDIGRVTHLIDQMHRSEDDAGDPIPSGKLLAADGARGQMWVDASGAGIYFNVVTYGAVGDDTTDDTTAIQDALDAAQANGGGTVYFPAGTYKITAALTIDSASLHILGDGGAAGRLNGGSTIRQHTANTNGFTLTYPAYPQMFEGIHVKGPTGNSSGNGITLTAGDFNSIDLFVEGFYNGLNHAQDAYYSRHYNLRVGSCDNIGVILHGGDTNDCHFYGARISQCAIALDVGGDLAVSYVGGVIEFNSTAGIRANGGGSNGAGLTISGTYMEHDDGIPDILLGNSSVIYAVTVVGVTFVKSAYSGSGWHIDGQNVTGLTVIGCEFMSSDAVRAVGSSAGVVLLNNHNRNTGTLTLPSGSINVDTSSTTPSADGSNAAGSSTKVARADHTHALGGTAGGDLSGTYPNPTVAKWNGVSISGTPSTGQVPTATGTTAATWQTPTGGGSTTGQLLIADTHSTPIIFADVILNEATDDFLYADP